MLPKIPGFVILSENLKVKGKILLYSVIAFLKVIDYNCVRKACIYSVCEYIG